MEGRDNRLRGSTIGLGALALVTVAFVAFLAASAWGAGGNPAPQTATAPVVASTPGQYFPPGATAQMLEGMGIAFKDDASGSPKIASSTVAAQSAARQLGIDAPVSEARLVRYSDWFAEAAPGVLASVDRPAWVITFSGLRIPSHGRGAPRTHQELTCIVDAGTGAVLKSFSLR